jgi:hypothetical protein
MEPRSGPTLARAPLNTTRAKSASGSGVQSPVKQVAGASAIHSAEAVSSDGANTVVANDAPVDRFRSSTFTTAWRSLRRADIRSPGLIAMGMSTGAAGTSWYQAECDGSARSEQSADVPTCSSARESCSAPPIPTQNAAELPGRLQTIRGCVQLPLTSVNARPLAWTT